MRYFELMGFGLRSNN